MFDLSLPHTKYLTKLSNIASYLFWMDPKTTGRENVDMFYV